MELCFATNNQHKLDEVAGQLSGSFTLKTLRDIGCTDELPETTGTIAGNSRQKAEYVWTHFGLSCFADDSGLEVEAINGEPGVDSAHYSGSRDAGKNIEKLLTKLAGNSNRKARFITVFTLILQGIEHQFEGVIEGQILTEPRGEGGFGYDPIFLPDGHNRTFAEMRIEEKNGMSHRSRALAKMIAYLEKQKGK
ncbi:MULTISPECIES: RdgB/HAM1 family non-canonical purine NTP pyrophosphatase [unclassified Spirosoma]|uniref:RdgB/HAM1 family non-canonical purine NTP pyrophosphatase n=1 Tax=unclassified Spirosoma TaxID=2621999 RepID=UPI00095B3205|nr:MULTISPECIES: RdgB/HAM1 family non-canonical purine NTP pyrophosphatase [unclassified Spirosoma]MBN8824681.1 RdgB/HAM1 family non-canonical purine NTP pyrophosphatase [Spirosoma sp.]OJW78773.1 MAG: non-canonical purine NTP pyrophosphatase, RdgB/HAM1 family [Spirosoma sp. 48-14]